MSSATPVNPTDPWLPDTAEIQRQADLTAIALRLEFEGWPLNANVLTSSELVERGLIKAGRVAPL